MEKSIFIGMPILQEVLYIDAAESLFETLKMHFPFNLYWKHHKGAYIDRNLCWLVEEAKKVRATHFLQLDSDLIFPPIAISLLVEHEKEVVGISYNYKTLNMPNQPHGSCPMVRLFGENGEGILSPNNILPQELFKCHTLPGGLMLVDMKVFEKIEKPYFESHWSDEPDVYFGEDFYFCEKVRKAGIDIWCDPNIPASHIGTYLY